MNKKLLLAALLIIVPSIAFAVIKLSQPSNLQQVEYYRTVPQCYQLTKTECVALLKNQIATAKQEAVNYWEGSK